MLLVFGGLDLRRLIDICLRFLFDDICLGLLLYLDVTLLDFLPLEFGFVAAVAVYLDPFLVVVCFVLLLVVVCLGRQGPWDGGQRIMDVDALCMDVRRCLSQDGYGDTTKHIHLTHTQTTNTITSK